MKKCNSQRVNVTIVLMIGWVFVRCEQFGHIKQPA